MKARLINVDKDKLCECLAMACPIATSDRMTPLLSVHAVFPTAATWKCSTTPLAMSIRLHSLATKQVETMRTDKMHHHQEIHHETD